MALTLNWHHRGRGAAAHRGGRSCGADAARHRSWPAAPIRAGRSPSAAPPAPPAAATPTRRPAPTTALAAAGSILQVKVHRLQNAAKRSASGKNVSIGRTPGNSNNNRADALPNTDAGSFLQFKVHLLQIAANLSASDRIFSVSSTAPPTTALQHMWTTLKLNRIWKLQSRPCHVIYCNIGMCSYSSKEL